MPAASADLNKPWIKISIIGKSWLPYFYTVRFHCIKCSPSACYSLHITLSRSKCQAELFPDNYQGEEADIAIISLTQSNACRNIGFMTSPEQLNVLLSYTQDALIIIGNAETFMNSRKGKDLWDRFMTLVKAGHCIYNRFPVKCKRYPDRHVLLRQPEDFDEHCPDGGCLGWDLVQLTPMPRSSQCC